MLVKLVVAFIGSGPVGVAVAPEGAAVPTPAQFHEACQTSLDNYGAEPAARMRSICHAAYAELMGERSSSFAETAEELAMAHELSPLAAPERAAYLVGECRKIAGERQDVCTKIGYTLSKKHGS